MRSRAVVRFKKSKVTQRKPPKPKRSLLNEPIASARVKPSVERKVRGQG
jgi:hypothetical protein